MRDMTAPFLILAVVTLVGACAAMMLRGLVHCALALAVAFAGIGTLYLSLGAQFLGLAQLLVYVGAIAVLIVFVILLTRGGDTDSPPLARAAFPMAAYWWRRRYSRSSPGQSCIALRFIPPGSLFLPPPSANWALS